MSLKKWILPLVSIALTTQMFSVSPNPDKIEKTQLVEESIELQIRECRINLQPLASSNPHVLKMYDESVAEWFSYYQETDNNFDLPLLLKAVIFSATKHEGQFRKDTASTPYIIHPLGVARSLWEEGQVRDENVLVAALLHDTLEDTDANAEEIESEFGNTVSYTVAEHTNDPSLSGEQNKQRQIDHAPALSLNAQLVKLADRLYNIRDLRIPPADWSEQKVENYRIWGEKLLHALKGTNPSLEHLLEKEITAQRNHEQQSKSLRSPI